MTQILPEPLLNIRKEEHHLKGRAYSLDSTLTLAPVLRSAHTMHTNDSSWHTEVMWHVTSCPTSSGLLSTQTWAKVTPHQYKPSIICSQPTYLITFATVVFLSSSPFTLRTSVASSTTAYIAVRDRHYWAVGWGSIRSGLHNGTVCIATCMQTVK